MIHTRFKADAPPRALVPFLKKAHYIEVKTFQSRQGLRDFLAGCFSYSPSWLTLLYAIRGKLVPLLGLQGHGAPQFKKVAPQDVPFRKGQKMAFFTVQHAEGNLWISGVSDKHLTAYLAAEKEQEHIRMYTLIEYHHWTGRLYYFIIAPFHHLVVNAMIRAGLRGQS